MTDQGASQLYQLTVGTDQTLSFNGSANSGAGPLNEATTPDGKYLYVGNDGTFNDGSGNTVSQYSIGSNGTLTPLSPSTVATGYGPVQIAVSPDGKNAYVANYVDATVTEYSIAGDGTLHLIGTLTGFQEAEGVSVSPDGASVYVGDPNPPNGNIFEYNRGSDGTLTPKSPASVSYSTGFIPDGEFTPDGKYFYVSGVNFATGNIDEYSVGSGGQLTPLAVPSVTLPTGTVGMVVSPNGHNVYASSCNGVSGNMYQYSVGSDGELTPLAPPFVSGGCGMPWMTANGGSLYVPDSSQSVDQFDVSSTGALSAKSPTSVSNPSATSLWEITIPPDQGPVAAFTSKAGKAGKVTTFNASGSSDSDGTVASYHWSFGDGTSTTSTSPTVSHTYKKAGKHTVTLTVTDDSGCSTTQVFTGQTAYCNGTPAATVSHTVKIAAAVKPLKLSVSPRNAKAGKKTCYALRATSKGHGVKKATVKLAGHKATTSAHGKAKLCLTLNKGTYKARATKHGYVAATARVHVSAASPAFTG